MRETCEHTGKQIGNAKLSNVEDATAAKRRGSKHSDHATARRKASHRDQQHYHGHMAGAEVLRFMSATPCVTL